MSICFIVTVSNYINFMSEEKLTACDGAKLLLPKLQFLKILTKNEIAATEFTDKVLQRLKNIDGNEWAYKLFSETYAFEKYGKDYTNEEDAVIDLAKRKSETFDDVIIISGVMEGNRKIYGDSTELLKCGNIKQMSEPEVLEYINKLSLP